MTAVSAIAAASGAEPPTAPAAPERKQTLDSEVFMKLLVTQLTNQDPSSPMDTNEMIAQTTQLASMEQLTALTGTATEHFALSMRQTAAALMGTEAQYTDDDGVEHSGVVRAVSFDAGIPTVTIGGAAVPLDSISGLTLASAPSAS